MKTYLYLFLIFTGLAVSCSTWNVEPKALKPVITPAPTADFVASSLTCTAPCSLTFTNNATNAASYQWDFGDNSPISTATSPVHSYTLAGTFAVKLTATSSIGSTTTQQTVTIQPASSGSITFAWEKLDMTSFTGDARTDVGVFVIDGKAYVMGGYIGPEDPTDEVWEFTPNPTAPATMWTLKNTRLPRPGSYATGFAYPTAKKGYLTGLYTDQKKLTALKLTGASVRPEVLIYNQTADTWTVRTDINMNRTNCSAAVLANMAYIGIGETNDGGTSQIAQSGLLAYDMLLDKSSVIPATSVNTPIDGLQKPDMFLNAAGDKLLIGGGTLRVKNSTPSNSSAYFEFAPNATTKFKGVANRPLPVLSTLILGGRYFGFTGNNTQVYEYKNDAWQLYPAQFISIPPLNDAVVFSIGTVAYLGFGFDNNAKRSKDFYRLTVK